MPHAGVWLSSLQDLAACTFGANADASWLQDFRSCAPLTGYAARRKKRSASRPHEPTALSLTDAGLATKTSQFQLPAFSNSKLDARSERTRLEPTSPQPTWTPGRPPGPSPASGTRPTLTNHLPPLVSPKSPRFPTDVFDYTTHSMPACTAQAGRLLSGIGVCTPVCCSPARTCCEGETASWAWESREAREAFNIQVDCRLLGLARELRNSAPAARACFW